MPKPSATDPKDPRYKTVVAAAQQAIRQGQLLGRKDLADLTGVHRNQVQRILRVARDRGEIPDRTRGSNRTDLSIGFRSPDLPTRARSIEELLESKCAEFERVDAEEAARHLVPVEVLIDGPVGICHMGDPHIDDPGSNFPVLMRDIQIINETEGLWAATVGDLQNNWCNRLAHLHAEQTVTAEEAWVMVEWLVRSVDWIYMVGGNHDAWSGSGDPLLWIQRLAAIAVGDYSGARIELQFPNGKKVRVNARHDFSGSSQWNLAHSIMKAFQMGFKDHVLTAGHRHADAYGLCVDPESGLIGHAIRTSGYKVHDSFAKQQGFVKHRVSPSVTTIIDPECDDDDPNLVQVIWDTQRAADYLTWMRAR